MIDEVIALSLRKSRKRKIVWQTAGQLRGIPISDMRFYDGPDGADFDSREAVVAAAEKDGFDVTNFCPTESSYGSSQHNEAGVCQAWSFLYVLKYIIRKGITALVLFDDFMITVEYGLLQRIVENLEGRSNPFYLFQLGLDFAEGSQLPVIPKEIEHEKDAAVFQIATGVRRDASLYCEAFLREGVFSHEESIIFSPTGAKWFMDHLAASTDEYFYMEEFIAFTLSKANIANIGVYCPNRPAYGFAGEIMHLGTNTDWVVNTKKFREFYEKSEKKGDYLHPDSHKALFEEWNAEDTVKHI